MEQAEHFYKDNLISTLYDTKREQGEITEKNIKKISEKLNIPLAKVYQVASFYEFSEDKKISYNILSRGPLLSKTSHELKDYKKTGGYEALKEAVEKGPSFVLEEIGISNLRGRGGAGFLAARKWNSCRKATGLEKYLIANGHNGDPGSDSDRYLMTHHCHQLIEGMILAAYAIGSSKGIIYVEGEFQDSIKNLEKAIGQAYKNNLLGRNILGKSFDFDLKIFEAAGVYVCGESTALMRAIEGKIGEPRVKHIHTAEKGLFNKPTVLNNVETLINVPYILSIGSEEYAKIGTETSKGTKVFSLIGDVNESGIVEVPMGTTLQRIVGVYGKGIKGKLKGIQFGGPLGGFLPEKLLKTKLCFDALDEAGSMMGDALTVIDDNTSIVELTKYFTHFLEEQSCGKCISCKESLRRINEILEDVLDGEGQKGDIEQLERLSNYASAASLCQLGKNIKNTVTTATNHFRKEFE